MSWHVFLDERDANADAPLISIRFNEAPEVLYVTRQILTHKFEAFEESPGVISTRATQQWVSELVGKVGTAGLPEAVVAEKLSRLVYLAVVGTSRLPITSLESPLPSFSLGVFSYWPVQVQAANAKLYLGQLLATHDVELASRALEFSLRATGEVERKTIIEQLSAIGADRSERLLRLVFNQAALAPHTTFGFRFVELVEGLADEHWYGRQRAIDTLAFMLRQLGRHLTAFDLSVFHSSGANYPDALLLEKLLKSALLLLEKEPQLGHSSAGRLVRRAFRGGALLRTQYEGHRVPDVPTSLGENARVLPASFSRVPEEQITDTGKRQRILFPDAPTSELFRDHMQTVLAACFADLDMPSELQELGTAIFLDRPLGAYKRPGEVDRTPLVSYVAFSRFLAARRLALAKSVGWLDASRHEELRARLSDLTPDGLVAAELRCLERPGVVGLADANKAAPDFVILRSTRGSLEGLLSRYDWRPLAAFDSRLHDWLLAGSQVLLVAQRDNPQASGVSLQFFRGKELQIVLSGRSPGGTMATYLDAAGTELLSALTVVQARDSAGRLVEFNDPRLSIQAK